MGAEAALPLESDGPFCRAWMDRREGEASISRLWGTLGLVDKAGAAAGQQQNAGANVGTKVPGDGIACPKNQWLHRLHQTGKGGRRLPRRSLASSACLQSLGGGTAGAQAGRHGEQRQGCSRCLADGHAAAAPNTGCLRLLAVLGALLGAAPPAAGALGHLCVPAGVCLP